ncbi:hypothetical protein FSY45_22980 [Comamonas sp. Z1]|uniref:hypothetical protein n=1 Tax=Comamonas sp. Z1 TaxID=2601246 RepID=UPI0011E754F5|nr:hypothetical protein [Comamonas sp. Z1]TYK72035.1 hypothetical protein FSY45_22980 [Comamonas sp. Z1]
MEPSTTAISLVLKSILSTLGGVFKRLWEPVTQFFFKEAYKVSTIHRSHRERKALCQSQLGEYLAYSINWRKVFLGKEHNMCTVWVKAKEGQSFKRATLCVTATLEKLRYQSIIVLYDLQEIPTVAAVPSVPIRQIEVRGNMVLIPYDSVLVELKELIDANEEKIYLKNIVSNCHRPFDNLEVVMGRRKSDVYRWGKWWNLDLLESEKHEIRIRYHGMAFDANFEAKRISYAWNSLLFRLTQWNWFLEACFWSKNLMTAKQLIKSIEKNE